MYLNKTRETNQFQSSHSELIQNVEKELIMKLILTFDFNREYEIDRKVIKTFVESLRAL